MRWIVRFLLRAIAIISAMSSFYGLLCLICDCKDNLDYRVPFISLIILISIYPISKMVFKKEDDKNWDMKEEMFRSVNNKNNKP